MKSVGVAAGSAAAGAFEVVFGIVIKLGWKLAAEARVVEGLARAKANGNVEKCVCDPRRRPVNRVCQGSEETARPAFTSCLFARPNCHHVIASNFEILQLHR